jgi:hypothetical protein
LINPAPPVTTVVAAGNSSATPVSASTTRSVVRSGPINVISTVRMRQMMPYEDGPSFQCAIRGG